MNNQERTGRAFFVSKPDGEFAVREVQYPAPQKDQVLLKVSACGICHSDSFAVSGHFPGLKYPVCPGHEIAGVIEAVGTDVVRLSPGDSVGVGWHGGHCGECIACRSGDFIACRLLKTPGISIDGGYAQYAIFPESVCALIPDELDFADAAPLLCAGVTTFNALRHSGAKGGDVVAIIGIGGLGHLAVQFANKMGFYTVAIARGDDKAEFAGDLGAHLYINSESKDAVSKLKNIGGAKVILATAASSKAMSPWVDALTIDGKMVIVGADTEPLNISPIQLIGGRKQIMGWPSGTAKDSEECMEFAARFDIRPMIEQYPFDQAQEAYERMMSGEARFRVVLDLLA